MTLNKARILSSENDASVKTQQTTNVNIKLHTPQVSQEAFNLKEPITPGVNVPTDLRQNVNGQLPGVVKEAYPSVAANMYVPQEELIYPPVNNATLPSNEVASRDVELMENLDDLEKQNQFLEMLVEVYENNPLRYNGYLICKSNLLMNMIKLLTSCDKVDLIINEDVVCTGCCSQSKYTFVSKILITKDGKSEDMKYKYNDVYSKFIKHGISLKIVI